MRANALARSSRFWFPLVGVLAFPMEGLADWGQDWGTMIWGSSAGPSVPALEWIGLFTLVIVLVAIATRLLRNKPMAAATMLLVLVAIPFSFAAATLTIPNIFANGTIADAGEVNANFGNVKVAVNDNFLLLDTYGPRDVSGDRNTALGIDALVLNTGSDNTATGWGALASNAIGATNTATGANALGLNTSGKRNTAMGADALGDNDAGNNNTAVGTEALRNATGENNTAVGETALFGLTTGWDNVALGQGAGGNITTGDNNIAIGSPGALADSDTTRIGESQTRAFIAGVRGVAVSSSESVVIDPSGQLGTVVSSARYKEAIEDVGDRSAALQELRPVSFRYRQLDAASQSVEYGLIAEEVAEVLPALVIFNEAGEPESVRYHLLPSLLLSEVQRLQSQKDAELAALRAEKDREIAALQRRLAQLEELPSRLATLEAQVATNSRVAEALAESRRSATLREDASSGSL